MKLKTPYKTVMFYGNVLHINASANWVAVDEDGTIRAFREEPYADYDNWESSSAAIWCIEPRMNLEDENWKDTLVHCLHDQKWMIEEAAELAQAWNLHVVGLLPSGAKELVLNGLADTMLHRAEGNTLQATWDGWMKHAVPDYLHDEDITNELYNRLFIRSKDPEFRIVKDYYGADVIVPGWANWIAMDKNGVTCTSREKPRMDEDLWIACDRKAVAWYPPEIARRHWQYSLREV